MPKLIVVQTDTSSIVEYNTLADSLIEKEDNVPALFINKDSSDSHNFPFTQLINKELSLDWVLYISLGILVIFAWVNIIYTRFIRTIMQSTINFRLSQKLFVDPNTVQNRISLLFNLVYYFSTSLYLFLIAKYFNLNWLNYPDFLTYFTLMGFLGALSLIRIFLYKGTGLFFDSLKLFNEALFQNFLYNKFIGIIIVPFNILIAYTLNIYQDIAVVLSISVIIGINILRLVRGVVFINNRVISFFYFILYLCTLEILPLLVIIKLILSLAKVS